MIRAGVLAASYKFKVLSQDAQGQEFLVMLDLADSTVSANLRMRELETVIIQAAKMRHNITITGVYWRINEAITTGISTSSNPPAPPTAPAPATSAPPAKSTSAHEPIQQDEIAAFKRSFSNTITSTPAERDTPRAPSVRGKPTQTDFEDTEMFDPDEQELPPGGTHK
jgi:hypothetical protein